jgi:2-hydroxy-6-oxonona-2,4-dienedioate hydrolase
VAVSSDPVSRLDHLDPERIRFGHVAAARTRYWEAGAGEPLILVHGGEFGDLYSLDAWSLNLTDLATTFHVFAFDRLGQGFTDNPRARDRYTIDAVMEHVTAFVETVAPSPAHLVGHSRGGFLVMRLALERPDLACTVTIVDSNTAAPENPAFPSGRFYEDLERRIPGPARPDIVDVEPQLQSYSAVHITDDFLERRRKLASLPKLSEAYLDGEPGRRATWESGLDRLRRDALSRIDRDGMPVPVLVVWGRDDPSAPLPLGLDLFDRLSAESSEVQLHVINRAGHYAFREHPMTFNALVRAFCLRQ